ncbi:hypothetical protein Vafri_1557 [Volvox africanus]|nr:hypothetical protein Vafri_1557 [Volvox africanus]
MTNEQTPFLFPAPGRASTVHFRLSHLHNGKSTKTHTTITTKDGYMCRAACLQSHNSAAHDIVVRLPSSGPPQSGSPPNRSISVVLLPQPQTLSQHMHRYAGPSAFHHLQHRTEVLQTALQLLQGLGG